MRIMTSNAPDTYFKGVMDAYKQIFSRFVGSTEYFVCGDTLQLKDYSKTDWCLYFYAEHKYKMCKEVFPRECQKVFEMGSVLVNKKVEA